MEKTLTIDGRQVRFKSTGGTLMRYRNQFNSEFLTDFAGLAAVKQGKTDGFSLASMEQLVWSLAKTADPSIPDPQTWYDGFDEIDIIDVFGQLSELVTETLKPLTNRIKNAAAAAGH